MVACLLWVPSLDGRWLNVLGSQSVSSRAYALICTPDAYVIRG